MRASTFTGYINVEPARNIDAQVAAVERRVNASFARMQAAASKAGATTGGTVSNIGAGAGGQRGNLVALVAAQNAAVISSSRLSRGMALEASAARLAAKETGGLERVLRTTAATASAVQGPLGPIAGRVTALAASMRLLGGVGFGATAATAAAAGFVHMASSAQDLKSALRPLYETQQDLNVAWLTTIDIANRARVSLQPVVDLYARLTLAGRSAGLSQQRISKLTEVATKATKLSGGTSVSQEAALYQFSQGIGSGNLGGDELRSVREGALRLAKAIADGLGVPIAKLKELGKEGKLTPKLIADALESQTARIDAELSRLPQTISSGSAKLSNAFTTLINKTDEQSGVTRALGEAMALLADNLPAVVKGLEMIALAYAGLKVSNIVRDRLKASEAWGLEQRAMQQAAQAQMVTANTTRRASASRIIDLRAERAALQSQIIAEKELRATLNSAAIKSAKTVDRSDTAALANHTRVVAQAQIATDNYLATKNRLKNITFELRDGTAVLTGATKDYRASVAASAKAAAGFGNAMRGLWAAINPVGIALGIGISLLIEYAFRQSEAAGASDRMAQSQVDLAHFIDLTTGAITEQNKALLENQIRQQAGRAKDARKAADTARGKATAIGEDAAGYDIASFVSPDPDVKRIMQAYKSGKTDETATTDQLSALLKKKPNLAPTVSSAIAKMADVETSTREARQAEASVALLSGKNTAENRRLAQGNFSGKDFATPSAPAAAAKGESDKERRKREAAERAAEAARQKAQNLADRRTDINARYSTEPAPLIKARRDIRELNELVNKTLMGVNGKMVIYTQEEADAESARIMASLRRPFQEFLADQSKADDLSRLRIQGYDLEAAALERAQGFIKQGVTLNEEDLQVLYKNELQQQRINAAMEDRQRLANAVLATAQETRDAFEEGLVGLTKNPAEAFKNFANSTLDSVVRLQAKKMSDSLFSGADLKLRDMLDGPDGIKQATAMLSQYVTDAAGTTGDLITANEELEESVRSLASVIDDVVAGVPAGGVLPGVPGLPGVTSAPPAAVAATKELVNDIVVQGKRMGAGPKGSIPTTEKVFKTGFEGLGDKLDKTLGTKFFKGIGGAVGKAFAGAGEGMMASGLASAIGIKQDSTGAAIGGALGSFLGPLGGVVGGLLGGTIGGFLKKAPSGSANLGLNSFGEASITGTRGNKDVVAEVSGIGSSVNDQLNQLAGALGAQLGAFSVAIGKYGDYYRVSASGSQDPSAKYFSQHNTNPDSLYDGPSLEEATRRAVINAISDGAIKGISAASQRILASGQDLSRALNKALAIESVPKRLLALTDPTRAAITELNSEFSALIGYLKEGGGTAQQYADAEKLYNLEREKALEDMMSQAVAAYDSALASMRGGTNSPFNKRTVYENANAALSGFRTDIAAGKTVNQQDLLTATSNFEAASRALFGSDQSFFTDFSGLIDLISKARDNVLTGQTAGGALPGSPFQTDAVPAYLRDLNIATANQTDVLAGKLDELNATLALYASGNIQNSAQARSLALRILPGNAYA